MREAFVTSLVADVLGPRNGIRETITQSPLGEYITGVLSPVTTLAPHDIEAAAELPTEDTRETEETGGTEDAGDVAPFAPVLNPQSRPFSMGLSFAVRCDGANPVIDICVTWARYARIVEGHDTRWLRQPRARVLVGQQVLPSSVWLDGNGAQVVARAPQAEVSLHLTTRALTPEETMVTLHFVNRLPVPANERPRVELHIFQPQLRVRCAAGTRVVSGFGRGQHEGDEAVLAYLYRRRPVLARGHLTSAMWAAIDPEARPGELNLDFQEASRRPPFHWTDGELLSEEARERFTAPDVRTEYVPLVSVPMPELKLQPGYGEATERRADALAELFDPDALRNALSPLVSGYRRWIGERRDEIIGAQPPDGIGQRLLSDCDLAADRIDRGIGLLHDDIDARLAFCFSMKAMALQHSWPNAAEPLIWHPFQLAFILSVLESIVDPNSDDRETCDVLWVPTGGGKTEAYLALLAFTIAYRRRRARRGNDHRNSTGAGVSVISRYTLRLLTIQQFRRTLKLVTACDVLRLDGFDAGGAIGWRPRGFQSPEQLLWGAARFALGLWVGAGVTPNRLSSFFDGTRNVPGALGILQGEDGDGEPAQVLRCPACDGVLSIAQSMEEGVDRGERVPPNGYVINWTVKGPVNAPQRAQGLVQDGLAISTIAYAPLDEPNYGVITVRLTGALTINARTADLLWSQIRGLIGPIELMCAHGGRPGYFLRRYQGRQEPFDFEVICPSPTCPLRHSWFEGAPAGFIHDCAAQATAPVGRVDRIPELHQLRLAHVLNPFRARHSQYIATRVPIPAYTVDDQIYHRVPSVVIATADKFARPAFEPRASAIFGNVDRHHCIHGFYREYLHPGSNRRDQHPTPAGRTGRENWVSIVPFDVPDLILQDELHLIEGPLGSLVGVYEAVVDILAMNAQQRPVKYIASTATVRQASEQVRSVFNRGVAMFPPPGLTADDSFFVRMPIRHALNDVPPGRLYLGVCAPGRGPLTPVVRIWARLLQTAFQLAQHARIDPYWTLAGYFNAIRELAGARALYRQDIPERLELLAGLDGIPGIGPRALDEDRSQELSGRMGATRLPAVLDLLNEQHTAHDPSQDALFTTSMFGTGVDVPRLSLMVVNGQPKTTSAYIQATGRVGRRTGALVPTFLRSTRPRDLNHYEFFCGYHVQLHRFVESITVMPFAPGVLDRALGPVGVFLLRNQRSTQRRWAEEGCAPQMGRVRANDPDVTAIPLEFERRASTQPRARRPPARSVLLETESALDDWHAVANRNPAVLKYVEYTDPPTAPVVLGDARHQHRGLDVAYENAPQSLRDIEETCGFRT